jgi:hypothetical protein
MGVNTLNALLKNASADVRYLWAKQSVKLHGEAKIELLANGMNKTEALYASHLELLKRTGAIHAYEWTGTNKARAFKIGQRRRYKPDFYVWLTPDRLEIHEIKGYLRDGGSIRFDLAAEANPHLIFRMIRHGRDGWEEMRVRNIQHAAAAAKE